MMNEYHPKEVGRVKPNALEKNQSGFQGRLIVASAMRS